MQVALTVWNGRISPLFDATRTLLVADVRGRLIISQHFESLDRDSTLSRINKLRDLGVGVLICGGISDIFANLIEGQGIQIIPFASGTVEEVLEAYLAGNLCQRSVTT